MSAAVMGSADPADAERRARQLRQLRRQRALLSGLRDDVMSAVRSLPDDDLGGSWQSPAQRGYAERRRELLAAVAAAGRRLDDAIDAVTLHIARLS